MQTVFLTEPIHEDAIAHLRAQGFDVACGWRLSAEDRAAALGRARVLISRIATIDAAVMEAAPNLALIARHGVGVDAIDLAAAAQRRIAVANTPGANAGAVAEHALMLLLALSRQLVQMDHIARTDFPARHRLAPRDLAGQAMLVLGFGAIGQSAARLFAALGMKVTVWHRRLTAEAAGYPVIQDLDHALRQTQAVSIHLPLNDGTRGLIGARELALLPDGAFVINTGRGGIVDEYALAEAAPRLGGIGLDVFAQEPPPPDHPLLRAPNTLFTPHCAALSPAAFRAMGMMAAQNVLDFEAGALPAAHRVDLGAG